MTSRTALRPSNGERIRSGVAVALIHLALGYALIMGLGVHSRQALVDRLTLVQLAPEAVPPPLPESTPAPRKTPDPEGAASPANLRATPTPIVVPPPIVRVPVVNPLPAAPIASTGSAPDAGAAAVPGPGTGAGGEGVGLGSGDSGSGTGGGGGGRPLRLIRGGIGQDDYPRGAIAAGASGTVHLRFTVAPDGRVADCRVTRSSGNRDLDKTTCRLIRKRFLYRPATDASGRAIFSTVTGEQEWHLTRQPDRWVDPEPVEN